MSANVTSTAVRVRAQARSTAWNKYIYVAGFVAAALVVIVTAGGPGTLLTAPILFVVYVSGHYTLGQRTIEANAHEVTIRSGGSRGRILERREGRRRHTRAVPSLSARDRPERVSGSIAVIGTSSPPPSAGCQLCDERAALTRAERQFCAYSVTRCPLRNFSNVIEATKAVSPAPTAVSHSCDTNAATRTRMDTAARTANHFQALFGRPTCSIVGWYPAQPGGTHCAFGADRVESQHRPAVRRW